MGRLGVKSALNSSLVRECGCSVSASRIMKSVTLTTRKRSSEQFHLRMEAATMTSNISSDPIPTRTTSGSRPASVLQNFQMEAPAWQCFSASSTERKTGWGCFEPTIRLTSFTDWRHNVFLYYTNASRAFILYTDTLRSAWLHPRAITMYGAINFPYLIE